MATVAQPKKKIKKKFVIRDTSAEIYNSLTPQAAHLWMTLRRLANAKTGELCLPNGQWITGARISREAKMHRNTRSIYMRELSALGLACAKPHYEVKRIADRFSGHVRKRKVRVGFHYSVSESPRPDWLSTKAQSRKPHKQRVSTKAQSAKTSTKAQFLCSTKIVHASTVIDPPDGAEADKYSHVPRGEAHPAAAVSGAPLGIAAKLAAAAADIDRAFEFFSADPYGTPEFQLAWLEIVNNTPELTPDTKRSCLPFLMERLIQLCHRRNIPVPPPFYEEKRLAEHFHREQFRPKPPTRALRSDPKGE